MSTSHIQTRLILFVLWSLTVFFVSSVLVEFAPTRWFFHYYSITPTNQYWGMGNQKIMFISDLQVNVPMDLEFNDKLRCEADQYENKWGEHTSQTTRSIAVKPGPRKKELWAYRAEFKKPNRCYLESNITGKMKFGPITIEKKQIVNDTLTEVSEDEFITILGDHK